MGKKFAMIIILIIIFYGVTSNGIYYGKNLEPLQGYFNINEKMIVEKGERITFKIVKDSDNELKDVITRAFTNINEKIVINASKKDTFEFTSKNIYGYVEKDRNNVIIYYKTENNKISINKLEDEMCKIIQGNGYDLQVYQYIKAKSENNFTKEKERILTLLKDKGAENIKEVTLEKNNRTSISANSHSFSSTKILDTYVDVNVSISNYNTGCYIIIGTPIIPITY